jgi:hypothetical protein
VTTDVDFDLLAEHLEGGLAGTPEGARVAELVATDPEWARAAAELSAALAAVAADLRTLPPPGLPEDVAARLDAVLRDEPALTPASVPPRLHERPADGRPGSVPAAGRGPARQRRRRLAMWGAGVAVAAGVLAFAAVGLGSLVSSPGGVTGFSADQDDGGGDDAPEQATDGALSAPQPLITASGTDYSPSTLGSARAPTMLEENPDGEETDVPPAAPRETGSLARLGAEPALTACLEAVAAEVEPPPGTIDVVEFASFQGEPALVIWLTSSGGEPWAWVAGTDCGTAGAGADIRFGTPVS